MDVRPATAGRRRRLRGHLRALRDRHARSRSSSSLRTRRRWPAGSRLRTRGSCSRTERSVVGYAYAGTFHPRAAYRFACETSVYLQRGFERRGGGRALYAVLLPLLREQGFTSAIAGMTLPNDGSVGLHRALGFELVGTYRRVGFKFDTWHDVAWTQLMLDAG